MKHPTCEKLKYYDGVTYLCERPAVRVSYRYNDKKRKYQASNRFIIHTGHVFLCTQHIKKLTKI